MEKHDTVAEHADKEIPEPPPRTPEELAAEAEAAAYELVRQRLQLQCESVDDAEEVCVFMVQDALEAVFEEMRVSSENASVFARTSGWATNAVFSGMAMSTLLPETSLDRPREEDATSAKTTRQQILKLNDEHIDSDSNQDEGSPKLSEHSTETPSTSLCLLRRLLEFLEQNVTKASLQLIGFDETRYITRKSHSRSHQSTGIVSRGDWEIPTNCMGRFLAQLVKRCHIRVLPSTLKSIQESSAAALGNNARANATLTLNQITHYVRKAVLEAEEQGGTAPLEKRQDDSRINWVQETFQTEVNRRFSHDSASTSFQICYEEEAPSLSSPLDRNAPGRIAKKTANPPRGAIQKQLARRVIMAMKPGPKSGSKWLQLRANVVQDADPAVVQVNIDADMELAINESAPLTSDAVTMLSPKKPSAPPSAGSSPVRAGRSNSKSIAPPSNKERQIVSISTTEPDTAALSNIFSLGTPRQLSADELSRRNDILAHLEREESQHQRRLANASIAAMTFPPSAHPSCSEERAFRAYVAANSSITTGVDSDFELPISISAAVDNITGSSPPPVAPRRPEMKNMNQSPNKRDRRSSKQPGGRSKFELACDPPLFSISDVDTRVGIKSSLALYSPIRKADSPGKGRGDNESHLPVRPVQSPSAQHLPQLDTSRLAVGVRAVVRGVEKRGPRRNPSRQSRLKLHNYSTGLDEEEGEYSDEAPTIPLREKPRQRELVPHSPVRYTSMQSASSATNGGSYLPIIPPVSPIAQARASPSPQRLKQVAFVESPTAPPSRRQKGSEEDETSSESPLVDADGRRTKRRRQQLVFDKQTVSPPRVRNRHFTDGRRLKSKKRTLQDSDDSDYERDRRSPKEGGNINIFTQPLDAPRRPR